MEFQTFKLREDDDATFPEPGDLFVVDEEFRDLVHAETCGFSWTVVSFKQHKRGRYSVYMTGSKRSDAYKRESCKLNLYTCTKGNRLGETAVIKKTCYWSGSVKYQSLPYFLMKKDSPDYEASKPPNVIGEEPEPAAPVPAAPEPASPLHPAPQPVAPAPQKKLDLRDYLANGCEMTEYDEVGNAICDHCIERVTRCYVKFYGIGQRLKVWFEHPDDLTKLKIYARYKGRVFMRTGFFLL